MEIPIFVLIAFSGLYEWYFACIFQCFAPIFKCPSTSRTSQRSTRASQPPARTNHRLLHESTSRSTIWNNSTPKWAILDLNWKTRPTYVKLYDCPQWGRIIRLLNTRISQQSKRGQWAMEGRPHVRYCLHKSKVNHFCFKTVPFGMRTPDLERFEGTKTSPDYRRKRERYYNKEKGKGDGGKKIEEL